MKEWIVIGTLMLSSCAQFTHYQQVIKSPAPENLQGNWQASGVQRGLNSEQAMASLNITPAGDTLDCRQWQRVIVKPGKLTRQGERYVNVNNRLRVMPLAIKDGVLHYDGLRMRRVTRLTDRCQQAIDEINAQSNLKVQQTIETESGHTRPDVQAAQNITQSQ